MNCYEESIRQVLDDYKVSLPDEAIREMIYAIGMCHEYATYSTRGYNSLAGEIDTLRKDLKREREKTICDECNGRGRIIEDFGFRSSDFHCSRCSGTGFIYQD